jgi:cation transport ATPase
LRLEAQAALGELGALGLTRQVLMIGDRSAVAARVAMSLGIDEIVAERLPEEKMERVRVEVAAGGHPMVVGDGINDGLALKVGRSAWRCALSGRMSLLPPPIWC